METLDKIKKQIAENPILIYMKGSPKLPSCGFSARASEALMNCKVPFGGCDIILEMYQAGELQTLLSEVAAKHQA